MIKVNLIGFDNLQKRLEKASTEVKLLVDGELQASAMEYVGLAKRDLASQGGDRGTLLRSIAYSKEGDMSYTVSANTFYAPFIEFGTKSKFKPYPGTEEYAAQFKGGEKKGDWIEMLMSIYSWVKRKGIGVTYNVKTKRKNRQTKDQRLSIAFAITMSILKNGISPKPFFYKQIIPVRTKLLQNLNRVLDGI